MQHRLGDRVEGPGSDDVMALRANIRWEKACVAILVIDPVGADLRGERAREPGIEDVGVCNESAGLITLGLTEAFGRIRGRVDGHGFGLSHDRILVVQLTFLIERIPDGNRHTKEPLPRETPVEREILGPVAVPGRHVGGMPFDLLALRKQIGFAIQESAEPLTGREKLEGSISLFVELDGMLDRFGLFLEWRPIPSRAGFGLTKHLDYARLSSLDRLAFELGVSGVGLCNVETLIGRLCEINWAETSIGSDHLTKRQLLLAPPLYVRLIAERTHHQHARSLLGVRHLARKDRHRRTEERRDGTLAEKGLIAFIVGMRRHTHTCRQ